VHDHIGVGQGGSPLRLPISTDQLHEVTANRRSPCRTDEVGGSIRASERTDLVPVTDEVPHHVLPDESASAGDKYAHRHSAFFVVKLFDIKLYER
jgi:hypothetical protein